MSRGFLTKPEKTMTKEKTILEWLEELPDGYRELALKNYDPEFCDTGINIFDLADAVMWGFSWSASPEGFEFWKAVFVWGWTQGELPPLSEGEEMKEERLVTRNEIGKLILIRFKDRIEEVVVRSVSPNGKFMKVNIGHEIIWLDIGDHPIWDILPDTRRVRDLCGLPEEGK